ncbi:hypothetical protein FN846DRAFT_998377 [Sphaerosporella brunnea]|uniref:Uncharacterized protein n=1 Tax=Sphaerosporella brunnea TaxID=1250544 RepID=A0A5J5FBK5_9PEZI|nr:hypothetical protein FN846DRAFT_998377 [Sphaerosporella brunnea]
MRSDDDSEHAPATDILLDGRNFDLWLPFMEGRLRRRRIYSIATRAETEPKTVSKIPRFCIRSEHARTTILVCMTSEILQIYEGFEDPAELWERLRQDAREHARLSTPPASPATPATAPPATPAAAAPATPATTPSPAQGRFILQFLRPLDEDCPRALTKSDPPVKELLKPFALTPTSKVYIDMHSMTRRYFQHTNEGKELAVAELFTAERKQRFCDVIGSWDFSDEVVAAFCRRGTISDNLREWLMYMLFKSIRKTVKKNPKGARRMVQSSRSPLSSPEVGRAIDNDDEDNFRDDDPEDDDQWWEAPAAASPIPEAVPDSVREPCPDVLVLSTHSNTLLHQRTGDIGAKYIPLPGDGDFEQMRRAAADAVSHYFLTLHEEGRGGIFIAVGYSGTGKTSISRDTVSCAVESLVMAIAAAGEGVSYHIQVDEIMESGVRRQRTLENRPQQHLKASDDIRTVVREDIKCVLAVKGTVEATTMNQQSSRTSTVYMLTIGNSRFLFVDTIGMEGRATLDPAAIGQRAVLQQACIGTNQCVRILLRGQGLAAKYGKGSTSALGRKLKGLVSNDDGVVVLVTLREEGADEDVGQNDHTVRNLFS